MGRGMQIRARNANSARNRTATNARQRLQHTMQSRSQALLRSKELNNARPLRKSELQALTNPRRSSSKVDPNFKALQENGSVTEYVMDLAEQYLSGKLKELENDPSMAISKSRLLLENHQAARRITNEYVYGLLQDVDGNTIYFKGSSGLPYIIVSDFEELRNYVVIVDVFAVTVSDSRGNLPCTFENPEGAKIVLATRPAPMALPPGGSIFIPVEEFLGR